MTSTLIAASAHLAGQFARSVRSRIRPDDRRPRVRPMDRALHGGGRAAGPDAHRRDGLSPRVPPAAAEEAGRHLLHPQCRGHAHRQLRAEEARAPGHGAGRARQQGSVLQRHRGRFDGAQALRGNPRAVPDLRPERRAAADWSSAASSRIRCARCPACTTRPLARRLPSDPDHPNTARSPLRRPQHPPASPPRQFCFQGLPDHEVAILD